MAFLTLILLPHKFQFPLLANSVTRFDLSGKFLKPLAVASGSVL